MKTDEIEVLKATIQFFEDSLTPFTKEQTNDKQKKGEYQYIPLDASHFISDLQLIKAFLRLDGKTANFIDVGCGYGTKLVMANKVLHDYSGQIKVTGLEITPEYVGIAKRLIKTASDCYSYYGRYGSTNLGKIEVIQGDGREFDYSPYNVIYFYCPMCTPELQRVLETRIMKTAKVGSYVIAHNKQSNSDTWAKMGFKFATDHIYKKVYKKVK